MKPDDVEFIVSDDDRKGKPVKRTTTRQNRGELVLVLELRLDFQPFEECGFHLPPNMVWSKEHGLARCLEVELTLPEH